MDSRTIDPDFSSSFFSAIFFLVFFLFWLIKKRTNQFEANSSKGFSVFFSKNFTQENKFFDIFEFRIISMIYVLYFLTKILCKFLLIYDFSQFFFENNYRIDLLFELFFNENVKNNKRFPEILT